MFLISDGVMPRTVAGVDRTALFHSESPAAQNYQFIQTKNQIASQRQRHLQASQYNIPRHQTQRTPDGIYRTTHLDFQNGVGGNFVG